MSVELELKARELRASEKDLATRNLQLKASEDQLVTVTLQLQTSDIRVADLARQLQASENALAKKILQLKISDEQLLASSLQVRASESREAVNRDTRDGLITQLNQALSGKTILLKEIHHRVKNNLAVIASLLDMQAATLTDERVISAFSDSRQRVMSMALIHESLYGSDNMDRLNFREYLEKLVDQVHAAYSVEADLVTIQIDAEDVDLPINRVIACGLIVNEFLSNALKYAYPRGKGGGVISLRFARVGSGALLLSCQDNGEGIPASFDWKNAPSLGLRIIQILTTQVHGELTLDRSQGTKFELIFPNHDRSPDGALT